MAPMACRFHVAIIVWRSPCFFQLLRHMNDMPQCFVGTEPRFGAHDIARELLNGGQRRSADEGVVCKAALKSNKNDDVDGKGIVEAVRRPTMRFVSAERASAKPPNASRTRQTSDD
jgi:hypothetical protein